MKARTKKSLRAQAKTRAVVERMRREAARRPKDFPEQVEAKLAALLAALRAAGAPKTKSCGCLRAGIVINHLEIEKCDACNLFETDADAAAVVGELLVLFGALYERCDADVTVADALDEAAAVLELVE